MSASLATATFDGHGRVSASSALRVRDAPTLCALTIVGKIVIIDAIVTSSASLGNALAFHKCYDIPEPLFIIYIVF